MSTPLIVEYAYRQLHDVLYSWVASGRHELDILRSLSNAALEFISEAGMGHSFDLIRPDADMQSLHPMAHAVKNITYVEQFIDKRDTHWHILQSPLQTELALWWLIAAHAQRLGPPWFRRKLADLACIVFQTRISAA